MGLPNKRVDRPIERLRQEARSILRGAGVNLDTTRYLPVLGWYCGVTGGVHTLFPQLVPTQQLLALTAEYELRPERLEEVRFLQGIRVLAPDIASRATTSGIRYEDDESSEDRWLGSSCATMSLFTELVPSPVKHSLFGAAWEAHLGTSSTPSVAPIPFRSPSDPLTERIVVLSRELRNNVDDLILRFGSEERSTLTMRAGARAIVLATLRSAGVQPGATGCIASLSISGQWLGAIAMLPYGDDDQPEVAPLHELLLRASGKLSALILGMNLDFARQLLASSSDVGDMDSLLALGALCPSIDVHRAKCQKLSVADVQREHEESGDRRPAGDVVAHEEDRLRCRFRSSDGAFEVRAPIWDSKSRLNYVGALSWLSAQRSPVSRPSPAPPSASNVEALRAPIARSLAPVLVLGGTGTGKERVAKVIHDESSVARGEFVECNCAGIVPQFALADLLGSVDGAFTDGRVRLGKLLQAMGARPRAAGRRRGRSPSMHFVAYAGLELGRHRGRNVYVLSEALPGTLFLDEIADLPSEGQGALLRVLSGDGFMPLGWDLPEPIHVVPRVIAATRKESDLYGADFRQDLRARLDTWVVRTQDVASADPLTCLFVANARLEELNDEGDVRGERRMSLDGSFLMTLDVLVRAGRFDGERNGNFRGIRAAVDRARAFALLDSHRQTIDEFASLVTSSDLGDALDAQRSSPSPSTGSRSDAEEHGIAAMLRDLRERLDKVREPPRGDTRECQEVSEIVRVVAEVFGEESDTAKEVRRRAPSVPMTAAGLLEGFLPVVDGGQPTSDEERCRRELLLRLWRGDAPLNRKKVAAVYRRQRQAVTALATSLSRIEGLENMPRKRKTKKHPK